MHRELRHGDDAGQGDEPALRCISANRKSALKFRAHILQAAEDQFSAHGYGGASTKEIARAYATGLMRKRKIVPPPGADAFTRHLCEKGPAEIANTAGVSRALVYAWIHGSSKPKPHHLDAIGAPCELKESWKIIFYFLFSFLLSFYRPRRSAGSNEEEIR